MGGNGFLPQCRAGLRIIGFLIGLDVLPPEIGEIVAKRRCRIINGFIRRVCAGSFDLCAFHSRACCVFLRIFRPSPWLGINGQATPQEQASLAAPGLLTAPLCG